MGNIDERVHAHWDALLDENYRTPQEKLLLARQKLDRLQKTLDKEIIGLETTLEFAQRDIANAAHQQNRDRLTTEVRKSLEAKRTLRHHQNNRRLVQALILKIDDTRVSEVVNNSVYTLNACVAEIAALADNEAIMANVKRLAVNKEQQQHTRDAMETALMESSGEMDNELDELEQEVAAIVETKLKESSLPLLEKLPVLPPPPQMQQKVSSTGASLSVAKLVAMRETRK